MSIIMYKLINMQANCVKSRKALNKRETVINHSPKHLSINVEK